MWTMHTPNPSDLRKAKRAIVSVGLNGESSKARGFIVRDDREGIYIITAAHCLRSLPLHDYHSIEEWRPSCGTLVGLLGEAPTLEVGVAFVDPVLDIAVLETEGIRLRQDGRALVEDSIPVSFPPKERRENDGLSPTLGRAWVMSLAGKWFELRTSYCSDGRLLVNSGREGFAPGMSGSPIVGPDGAAIAVACHSIVACSIFEDGEVWVPIGLGQPSIGHCLPPRFGIPVKSAL
jgi:hypothetical protein